MSGIVPFCLVSDSVEDDVKKSELSPNDDGLSPEDLTFDLFGGFKKSVVV